MVNEIIPYQGLKLEEMAELPEERILEIACDLLDYCNHTVNSMNESIQATLARCDAIDKMGELYKKLQSETKSHP
jgi:hypothetical protein